MACSLVSEPAEIRPALTRNASNWLVRLGHTAFTPAIEANPLSRHAHQIAVQGRFEHLVVEDCEPLNMRLASKLTTLH